MPERFVGWRQVSEEGRKRCGGSGRISRPKTADHILTDTEPWEHCPGCPDCQPEREEGRERCPTCGSDDPELCRAADHSHPIWMASAQIKNGGLTATEQRKCCDDPFHIPQVREHEERGESELERPVPNASAANPDPKWRQIEVVAEEVCVSMTCCGFTFAADHTDPDGGYSCPQCAPDSSHSAALARRLERAEERVADLEGALERIEKAAGGEDGA